MPPLLQHCFYDLSSALPVKAHGVVSARTAFLDKNLVGPVKDDDEAVPRDKKGVPTCCNEEGEFGMFTKCAKTCDKDPRYTLLNGDGPKKDGSVSEVDLPRMLHKPPRAPSAPYLDVPPPKLKATKYLTIWKQQENAMSQGGYSWAADLRIGKRYPTAGKLHEPPAVTEPAYGKRKSKDKQGPLANGLEPPRPPVPQNTSMLQIDDFL
mmetsp:Transcript_80499/g.152915  ORF Transcript_80499/g.152915 Transcript_80499/m.152915 type:complete len:208 (+) Transcript_80499:88-711(+)